MAVFTSTDPGPLLNPNTLFNLGADLGTAQQLAQGQNALTVQAQQMQDTDQIRSLRGAAAQGNQQALNALTAISPSLGDSYRQSLVSQASMPYQIAQSRLAAIGSAARGILAADPAQRPQAYAMAKQILGPAGASLPDQYPGDGAIQQAAFAGSNPKDLLDYLSNRLVIPGASAGSVGGSSYAGAVNGAENSTGNPAATNPNSTAMGNGQFINSTWLQEMKTHRPDLTQGKSDNQILAMRSDPGLSTQMTNAYAADNYPQLAAHNIPITPASLATAHRFGPQGATSLYQAEASNPNTPAASVLGPDVIRANPQLAGQTVDQLLGGIRQQMAGVTPDPAVPIFETVANAVGAGSGGSSGLTIDVSGAAPAPAAGGADQSAAAGRPTPAGGLPPGVRLIYHGNGNPALSSDGNHMLGVDPHGTLVQVPINGSDADPHTQAVKAYITEAAQNGLQFVQGQDGINRFVPMPGYTQGKHDAAVAGNTSGPYATDGSAQSGSYAPPPPSANVPQSTPVYGGASTPQPPVPSTRVGPTPDNPLPAPPNDPYSNLANNSALADRMNADKTAAAKAVSDNAPLIQKDQQQIQNATQFHQINAGTPTGPWAGSQGAMLARSSLPFTPSNGPYQKLDKVTNEMKISGLPIGLGRLDIPIIKAVASQQPTITNLRNVNDNIEAIQIGRAQRDIAYRTAMSQWAQHNGTLAGFDTMWNDYNDRVPALAMSGTGDVTVNAGAPSFSQWAWARTDPSTGRYNPSLADVPDNQLPGSQTRQPQAAQPAASASASQPASGSIAVGQTATGPNGTKLRWDGQQWEALGGSR